MLLRRFQHWGEKTDSSCSVSDCRLKVDWLCRHSAGTAGGFSTLLKVTLTMLLKEAIHVRFICTVQPLITVTLSKDSQAHVCQETRIKKILNGKKTREESDGERPWGHLSDAAFSSKIASVVSCFFSYYAKTTQDWTGYNCIREWNMRLTQHQGPGDTQT